ncbi:MAG: DUF6428 family protein [Bacteroidota bacterium]
MKLSEVKEVLKTVDEVSFGLPDGSQVPPHFHVTEIGTVDKRFIDCGGTVRTENVICFQLWSANDFDHQLIPDKLFDIIAISERELGLKDLEVEVEYQSDTIGKYGLEFEDGRFVLQAKMTNCLAPEKCGVPLAKPKVRLSTLTTSDESGYCKPGSGCC